MRWLFWTAFYRLFGRAIFTSLGRGCWFEGWIDIPQRPGELRFGHGVRVAANVTITVSRSARVSIGDGVFIGRGSMLSAHQRIEIGARTMVAAYVGLHDNDHRFDTAEGVSPEFVKAPLLIGEGCWLGTHSVIVRGGGMGNGCLLGAGAVLTNVLPPGTKAVGVPARSVGLGAPDAVPPREALR